MALRVYIKGRKSANIYMGLIIQFLVFRIELHKSILFGSSFIMEIVPGNL